MAVEVARLEGIPLFEGLTEADRASIAAKLQERSAPVGAHLTSEGSGGYFFFVIERGTAAVTRGGEHLADLGPGDFFGEASILATKRRTATVEATSPMELLELFGADFAVFESTIPELGARIRAALEAHLSP